MADAANTKQFSAELNLAIQKHADLLEDNAVSRPDSEGYVGILYAISEQDTPDDFNVEDAIFNKEAWRLARFHRNRGRRVELVCRGLADDLRALLDDSDCSSLEIIGHGDLGSMDFPSDLEMSTIMRVTWADVSQAVTHLKSGRIVQRLCAEVGDEPTAPLMTFAAARQDLIFADAGNKIATNGRLTHSSNANLRPIFIDQQNTADAIMAVYESCRDDEPFTPFWLEQHAR